MASLKIRKLISLDERIFNVLVVTKSSSLNGIRTKVVIIIIIGSKFY